MRRRALRVTSAFLHGSHATDSELEAARRAIRELVDGLDAPHADAAIAVGGTARAVAKIVGPRFGAKKLDALADRLARDGRRRA